MRSLGATSSLRVSRNPLATLGFLLLIIFAAYKAAEAVLANDLTSLILVGLLIVASAVVIAILNDWRRGFYLLVAWILFEDFIRKYLGNNMAIYFAKDVLAAVVYLSFFRTRLANRVDKFQIPFRVPLMVFSGSVFFKCSILPPPPSFTAFWE